MLRILKTGAIGVYSLDLKGQINIIHTNDVVLFVNKIPTRLMNWNCVLTKFGLVKMFCREGDFYPAHECQK